jgi:hypothetical protein
VALRLGFPNIYEHLATNTQTLCLQPTQIVKGLCIPLAKLRRPFLGSPWPTFTLNLGRQVCTIPHRNSGNGFGIPCAITAMGDFDPDFGGHLILPHLKLIICFPPSTTILIPSALFTHGNVPICEGETRSSFTQYCPGGLLHFVDWGFRHAEDMTEAEEAQFAARNADRVREALGHFSKLNNLRG